MAKKILLISDAISIHTQRWANTLASNGSEVKVLSFSPIGVHEYHKDVDVISLNLTSAYTVWDYIRLIMLANWYALTWRPSFVNAHYATVYGTVGLFVLFRPLITSVWGTDILIRPRRSKLARFLMYRILRRSKAVFATSKILASAASHYTNKPIFVIPFGIDEDRFSPKEVSSASCKKTIRIGCVKWMKLIYGLDVLIEAFSLVNDRCSEQNIELVLTGDGPDEEKVRALVNDKGLSDKVIFTGHLDQNEISKVHQSLDIAVYPSRSESFGVALIESQACQVPVIASNVGGIPEVVKDNETGFLVGVGDAQAIAEKIITLIEDPQLRKVMGERGREFVLSKYCWKDNVRRYQSILDLISKLPVTDQLKYLVDDGANDGVDNFVVFHYPGPIEKDVVSARPKRLNSMREAFSKQGAVFEIFGDKRRRLKLYAQLRYMIYNGSRCKLVYSESHTNATLLIQNLKKPDLRLIDYRILKFFYERNISVRLYIRDLHWMFPFYAKLFPSRKHFLYKKMFYWMDLCVWAKYADKIFVPHQKFNDVLPDMVSKKVCSELPPGADADEANVAVEVNVTRENSVEEILAVVDAIPLYINVYLRSGDTSPNDLYERLNLKLQREVVYVKNGRRESLGINCAVFLKSSNPAHDAYRLAECHKSKVPVLIDCRSSIAGFVESSGFGKAYASIENLLYIIDGSGKAGFKKWLRNSTFNMLSDKVFPFGALCEESPKDERLSILYAGGFGDLYQMHKLFNVIREREDVVLHVVCRAREFKRVSGSYGSIPDNVFFHNADTNWIKNYAYLFDVGSLILEPVDYLSYAKPVKFFDYVSNNLPVICSKGIGVEKEVESNAVGWCVNYDESSINGIFDRLVSDPSSIERMHQNIDCYVTGNSWEQRVNYVSTVMI